MKKSVYLVLATAMLAVIVMPIAFAGAAGNSGAKANASLKKQLKGLKERVATLEGKQDPVVPAIPEFPKALPPNGPAGGDLTGSYPNPAIKTGAVKENALAVAAVTETKIAQESVSSEKIDNGAVSAIDMNLDSVGSFALKGVTAVVGTGVSISAGTPDIATVTCPANEMLIAGGYAWLDKESNSIIASAPNEANPNRSWVVEGMVNAGSNTLFAWATCMDF